MGSATSSYSRIYDVRAGCFECWGSEPHWCSRNAHGLAVQHHRKYGHHVFVEVESSYFYPDHPGTEEIIAMERKHDG